MNKILFKTNQNHPQIKEYKEAVEKGMRSYHVLPHGNQWIVKQAGSPKALVSLATQSQAVDYAKSLPKTLGTAVFVHGEDGRIKSRQDYL